MGLALKQHKIAVEVTTKVKMKVNYEIMEAGIVLMKHEK